MILLIPYFFMTVLAPACILIPIATALLWYKKIPRAGKLLCMYLLAEAAILAISSILAHYKIRNTALFHFATVIETTLILLFFSAVFQRKNISHILYAVMIGFSVFAICNTVFWQSLQQFNSYTISCQAILIILLCFYYWWSVKEESVYAIWWDNPFNLVLSGLLLYYASSFILFSFSNYIITRLSKETSVFLWNVHAALSMVMYGFMAAGFYKFKQR